MDLKEYQNMDINVTNVYKFCAKLEQLILQVSKQLENQQEDSMIVGDGSIKNSESRLDFKGLPNIDEMMIPSQEDTSDLEVPFT